MPNQCGTYAGHSHHRRKSESPCDDCRSAYNAHRRERKDKARRGVLDTPQLMPCGTYAAYKRHKKKNEQPCDQCGVAAKIHWREQGKIVTGTPLDTSRCGTVKGYKHHLRRNLQPCEPCRDAWRRYSNERNRKRGIPEQTKAICGTLGGAARHNSRGELLCDECKEAKRAYARKKLGQQPFQAAKCGTRSGYMRHWRNGESACDLCLQAHRDAEKTRRHLPELWRDQKGICLLCDREMPHESGAIHVDHVVPRSKGGGDSLENLQAVHSRCNLIKRNRDNEEARRLILSRMATV